MGAHGTLEEALSNVASFRDASNGDQKPASSKSSKHKSHKKHKKSTDKAKDKKDQKKKHRRSKHSSSSDSDEHTIPAISRQTELAKGREAVRITRFILANYPEMRSDLREVGSLIAQSSDNAHACMLTGYPVVQLLRQIDQGAAIAIDDVPDETIRTQLASLFNNLLLDRTRKVLKE